MNSSSLHPDSKKKKLHTIVYGGHHSTGGGRETGATLDGTGHSREKNWQRGRGLSNYSASRSC